MLKELLVIEFCSNLVDLLNWFKLLLCALRIQSK